MSTFIQDDQEIRSTSVRKSTVHTCSNNVCVNICLLDASSLNYSPLNLGSEVCKVKRKSSSIGNYLIIYLHVADSNVTGYSYNQRVKKDYQSFVLALIPRIPAFH